MDSWTVSDYAAWWGAIVASLALLWNIVIAIRSGPRVRVSATANMQVLPPQPPTEENVYISVTAVNHGDASTTITNFLGYYVTPHWNPLKREKHHFIVNFSEFTGNTVPFVLEPGCQWRNLAEQAELQEAVGEGTLYIGIAHNQKKKPIYVPVVLNPA